MTTTTAITATTLAHEGKAKRVWNTADPALHIVEYTDRATAFNGGKRADIDLKGELNNRISCHFMELLAQHGVETHLVEQLSNTEQLVKRVKIVPLEVVTRNVIAGSLAQRTGLAEGTAIANPIVEFYYKDDDLGDPLLTRAHIRMLYLADDAMLDELQARALKINEVLTAHLAECGITLVDFKLEFGATEDGTLLLADEISPDTCRFWDSVTRKKLDKDRFRRDLGDVSGAYAELLDRVMGATR
jgi:phosphoribosylaminoimidazole-succinocarboxamide synthase